MNSQDQHLIRLQQMVEEKQKLINELECQIEEQKKLRIEDARQVEAKAAKIKEWVSSKFKELEQQNENLREENRKCHEYLSNLQNFYPLSNPNSSLKVREKMNSPAFDINGIGNDTFDFDLLQDVSKTTSPYAVIDPRRKKSAMRCQTNQSQALKSSSEEESNDMEAKNLPLKEAKNKPFYPVPPPRLHIANYQRSNYANTPFTPQLPKKLYNDLDSKYSLKRGGSLDRKLIRDHNQKMSLKNEQNKTLNAATGPLYAADGHDYSEVFESNPTVDKPPTPPLHRVPSWEERLYKIASNGIKSISIASTGLSSLPIKQLSPANHSNVETIALQTFIPNTVPMFACFNGRASQFRSSPCSDDSSDSTDVDVDLKSGHFNSLQSSQDSMTCPNLDLKRIESQDSDLSNDYALPPDAGNSQASLVQTLEPKTPKRFSSLQRELETAVTPGSDHVQKCGYLTKLGSKLKTWRKRWFVLKDNQLSYYKTQSDMLKGKAKAVINLDDSCSVTKSEGCTFRLSSNNGKKVYYLTADSSIAMEEWIRHLQTVLRNVSKKKLDTSNATIQGRLTRVKNGEVQKCWCTLIGNTFVYLSSGCLKYDERIDMEQAKVEEVLNFSLNETESSAKSDLLFLNYTIAIIPKQADQSPIYLLFSNRQEMDVWLYHLSFVADNQNVNGTCFERIVTKLMHSDDSDLNAIDNNPLWNDSYLLFTKESITSPLTSLATEYLRSEALKLFKSIQLFTSVALDFSAIDYHVSLIQNSLQLCLDHPELQDELFCQLIKQTSLPSSKSKAISTTHQHALHHNQQSSFDSSHKLSSPLSSKEKEDDDYSFKQAFQFLSLAISLFTPKEKTLWLLKHHLRRSENESREVGRYAIYANRALNRTIQNGPRECRPSRMEVLGILLRNPFQHSKPHSFLVHFANQSYLVIGFDGSTTIDEFVDDLTNEANLRPSHISGFSLFCDDPLDPKAEYLLKGKLKLADVISCWESALREKHFGKFEITRVLKLTYKNRLCLKRFFKSETDKEKLLLVYQYEKEMKIGRFPLSHQLSLELSALLAQMEFGDLSDTIISEDVRQKISQKFISSPFQTNSTPTNLAIQEIFEKWKERKGCSKFDCARIFLKCARKWSLCGASLFEAQTRKEIKLEAADKLVKINSGLNIWIAVSDDGISLLDDSLQLLIHYPMKCVLTFGGYKDAFMLAICSNTLVNYTDDDSVSTSGSLKDSADNASFKSKRLLFSMSKRKLIEITFVIADYINSGQVKDQSSIKFSRSAFVKGSSLTQTKM